MNVENATCAIGHSGDANEREPSSHELLNEATQWLQYARGVSGLLADLIHEADGVDCKQVALSLEAVASMTHLGLQRVGEAHASWHWQASR